MANTDRTVTGAGEQLGKHRIHNISTTLWRNGQNVSVTLQKGYKRKNEEQWQNVNMSIFPHEIDSVIMCLQAAKAKMESITGASTVGADNTM